MCARAGVRAGVSVSECVSLVCLSEQASEWLDK